MKELPFLALVLVSTSLLRAQMVNVTSTGVGIGTNTPEAKLEINGSNEIIGNTGVVYFRDSTGGLSNSMFVYGDSANRLNFGAANLTKMTIDSSGHVGIGTIIPGSLLTVLKTANDTVVVANAAFNFIDTTLGAGLIGQQKLTTPYAFVLQNQNQTNNAFFPVSLNPLGGNVGIGTTSPNAKLAIADDTFSGSKDMVSLGGSSLTDWYLNIRRQYDGGDMPVYYSFDIKDRTTQSNPSTATIYNNTLVLNRGNVGIGTTSPGYKLTVSGPVRASQFIADVTTYSDFVFKPGYRLVPLADVESAIRRDGHLPGVPSEAEARVHGVDVADMEVRLLQKVEELTLRLIAQEKELIAQEKRIGMLETENGRLMKTK